MAERFHTYTHVVTDGQGVRHRVYAQGEQNELGTWNGWLVFEPEEAGKPVIRTDRETTQPEREDLEYWAGGLEPIYLEGALSRARPG